MNSNSKKFRKGKSHNKDKNYGTPSDTSYYTKFKRVELVANGAIVMCKATTIDGVEEICNWNRQNMRELVKANCIPEVEIIVAPSVPKDMGWNYGRN